MIISVILVTTLIIFLFGCLVFVNVFLFGMSLSDGTDAPYVMSPHAIVDRIIAHGCISDKSLLVELGCGEARILRHIVRKTKCKGIGVERNPIFIFLARIYSRIDGTCGRIIFEKKDISEADLSRADVVYFFMTKDFVLSDKLNNHLKSNIRRGTVVISHWYEIPLLKDKEFAKEYISKLPTYFYKI